MSRDFETKHTPLPYEADGYVIRSDTKAGRFLIGVMRHGPNVPVRYREIPKETAAANAAFVVRACNEYDALKAQNAALVEALKEAADNYVAVVCNDLQVEPDKVRADPIVAGWYALAGAK